MSIEQATTTEQARPPVPHLVGRAELLDAVDARLAARHDVTLNGPSGIGKSEILRAVGRRADSREESVLHISGTESERWIRYSALADLLAQLPQGCLDVLPAPQRAAADGILRRTEAQHPPEQGELSCHLAWHTLLRHCAGSRPVLVLVDDVHWIDPSSMDAIRYAARRLSECAARIVVAGTYPDGGADGRMDGAASRGGRPWLAHDSVAELSVPALGPDDMAELLEGHGLPARVASRLHAESGGNPYLALALGGVFTGEDAFAGPHVPLPRDLHAVLGERIGALPEPVRETLLVAALADLPTIELLRRAGRAEADRDVRHAAAAGLLSTDDGTIRFTPPSVRAVLAETTDAKHRATVHTVLSEAATDSAGRARHQALACFLPDPEVANSLATAAESAAKRGTRGIAAELYLLAAERAPQEQETERVCWLVTAAEVGAAAGRAEFVHQAAEAVVAADSTPAQRVRARLAVIDLSGQALSEMDETFAAALLDAEDAPELLAPLRLRRSWAALIDGDPARSYREAETAIALAEDYADTATEGMALAMKATAARAMGRPDYREPLERGLSLPRGASDGWLHMSPWFLATRFDVFDDKLEHARHEYFRMLALVERGSGEENMEIVRSLSEVSARLGRCAEALDFADRAVRIAEQTGLSPGPAWYNKAVAELAGGSLNKAADFARRGIRASEQEQDGIYLGRHLHALAQALLRAGKVDAAIKKLRRLARLQHEQGVTAPLVLRWHADLAAALTTTGELDEAEQLITSTRAAIGSEHHNGGVAAQLDRADALARGARGDIAAAIDIAERAQYRFAELGQPLERGHCLLVRGQLERRRRRYAVAREVVNEALELFTRHGAKPWVAQARRGLSAADDGQDPESTGPTAAPTTVLTALTAAEERIARLVGAGASNQEVAARTYVSVKTVEASLTRVYRKLGIRSRTQLSSLLNSQAT